MQFKRTVRLWDAKTKGYINVVCEITLDVNALAQMMGERSYRNKTRKANMLGKTVIAKILEE